MTTITWIYGTVIAVCATTCFMYREHISYLKLAATKRYEARQLLLNAEKRNEQ